MTPIVSDEHKEERKKIILDAAKEVFIRKGYNATSMQDIINQSGVSRGGIYTYFLNTEDIFLELLRKRDLDDTFSLDALFNDCDTSWDALLKIFEMFRETIESNSDKLVPAIYEYYFTVGYRSKKHLPSIEARLSQIIHTLSEVINRGIQAGEFNPALPAEDIARSIISFSDGIYISVIHLGPEKVKVNSQFQTLEMYLKSCLFV